MRLARGLTGISDVNVGGFSVSDLTVINGEVLFIGTGTDGLHDLWVTNGTAAGTTELGGPANLGVSGGVEDTTLYPSNLTTFNGEVLFEGFVPPGVYGLWVSDGTAAGTHDVTGISGANQGGLLTGGISPDFTVFNGEVLFQGRDTVGNLGLWVTDGTAAGTHELTGIKGASAGGLDPSDLTIFKNEVFCDGVDANGQIGLWVTNGTVNGTHEIKGITGANTGPVGLNPNDLTAVSLPTPKDPPVALPDPPSADTFHFAPDFGNHTITNFNVHDDTIELPKSEFVDLAAIIADAHQVGADTIITHDAHDSITLLQVTLSQLHASNFHLV